MFVQLIIQEFSWWSDLSFFSGERPKLLQFHVWNTVSFVWKFLILVTHNRLSRLFLISKYLCNEGALHLLQLSCKWSKSDLYENKETYTTKSVTYVKLGLACLLHETIELNINKLWRTLKKKKQRTWGTENTRPLKKVDSSQHVIIMSPFFFI